jgi:hypothetical protein
MSGTASAAAVCCSKTPVDVMMSFSDFVIERGIVVRV